MASTSFMDRSRRVSERFLQTAVVVDDQPHYRSSPKPTAQVVRPGRARRAVDESGRERSASANNLDAKLLVDAFAGRGIVCAILQPTLTAGESNVEEDKIEDVERRADAATQRADIVVLDWNLRGEEANPGDDAKKIIRSILETDSPTPNGLDQVSGSRRLRLIAIYTAEVGLRKITDDLLGLAEEMGLANPTLGDHSVQAGPVTFVVYGKSGSTIDDPDEDASRRVREDDLPECLLSDFTSQTMGLLSNVALASLSSVRDNTHRVLNRFNPRVDAPYVAHRAMMEPPEEAAEHPVPLVAAEIEGILAGAPQIPELVSPEAIAEWLDDLEDVDPGQGLEMEFDDFKNRLLDLLDKGLRKHEAEDGKWSELAERLKDYRDREAASVLSDELTSTSIRGQDVDLEFAALTSVRSQYEEPTPTLRLGTIVEVTNSDGHSRYRLCIQPLCDSVRLSRNRSFPFLSLKKREEGSESPFEIVVNDRGEYVRLAVSLRAHEMELIRMKPNSDSKAVVAAKDEDAWMFNTSGDVTDAVRWVADLKTEFAHRVANMFAAEVSRVGLTESEWLRRMGMKYPPLISVAPDDSAPGAVKA